MNWSRDLATGPILFEIAKSTIVGEKFCKLENLSHRMTDFCNVTINSVVLYAEEKPGTCVRARLKQT